MSMAGADAQAMADVATFVGGIGPRARDIGGRGAGHEDFALGVDASTGAQPRSGQPAHRANQGPHRATGWGLDGYAMTVAECQRNTLPNRPGSGVGQVLDVAARRPDLDTEEL